MRIDSSIDVNTKLLSNQRELPEIVRRYRGLVRKLNYLTVSRPNIIFVVSVVSQHRELPSWRRYH